MLTPKMRNKRTKAVINENDNLACLQNDKNYWFAFETTSCRICSPTATFFISSVTESAPYVGSDHSANFAS
jgi:hypothetical protein